MLEVLVLLLGIIVFVLLLIKKRNTKFLELFQNPTQQQLEDVEQILFYIPRTLPDGLKTDLKNIITTILTDVNNMSTTKYYPGEYETVTLEKAKNGDKRYIIDMTWYDIGDRFNVRVLLDIIDKNKKYHLNNIRMVNADDEATEILNEIYGIDTNTIIDTRNYTHCPNYNVRGDTKSSLKSSNVKFKNPVVINGNPGGIRNKWVVNQNLSKDCDKNYPQYNSLCTWDKYGVINKHKANAYQSWPSYNPTITGLPHHEADPYSMFYLSRGIVDFPHGQ